MKERPILFSGPMVNAILEGRKTQTRRVVRVQPPNRFQFAQDGTTGGVAAFWWTDRDLDLDDIGWWPGYDDQDAVKCPYGSPGDRLWVRETWCIGSPFNLEKPTDFDATHCLAVDYAANERRIWSPEDRGKWRPSIHMPRWASRITLEITVVRVERLNEISSEDCIAEGLSTKLRDHDAECDLKDKYKSLWESINGTGSWDANPFVWVIEFRRVIQ